MNLDVYMNLDVWKKSMDFVENIYIDIILQEVTTIKKMFNGLIAHIKRSY